MSIFQWTGVALLALSSVACSKTSDQIDTTNLPTHNRAVFDQGRFCHEEKFACLPESRDPEWKKTEPLVDGREFFEFDQAKYDRLEKINMMTDAERKAAMENYVLTQEDFDWMVQVNIKKFYIDKELELEKRYPGFWGDTPRTARHRWMRMAAAKSRKYGYGFRFETEYDRNGELISRKQLMNPEGTPYVADHDDGDAHQFIELCARIGLNFDSDPKWKYIVDYISKPESADRGYAGAAALYIDFTVFGKNKSPTGTVFTDWSLKNALGTGRLPKPNRPLPKLHELSDEEMERLKNS